VREKKFTQKLNTLDDHHIQGIKESELESIQEIIKKKTKKT